MSREIAVNLLLFDVAEVPIEAVVKTGETIRNITVPGKKALIHEGTGRILGVVSRNYRVVTNREAVNIAMEVCAKAFPGITAAEWEPKRASAPLTLSYAFIDLLHRSHVLNYTDVGGGADDPFTPFLRVTNSFNGGRALRFDVGFLRQHCSNGVIFEEEVATITAAHSKDALEKLNVTIRTRSLDKLWQEFSNFIGAVRGVAMTEPQSERALQTVLRLPVAKDGDPKERREGISAMRADTNSRLGTYRTSLGENAYAVFNTLTDLAARPPESRLFQKDRDTLEKRAGRWLKQLSLQHQTPTLDLEKFITHWDEDLAARRSFRQN
jgi:hypothetical protein